MITKAELLENLVPKNQATDRKFNDRLVNLAEDIHDYISEAFPSDGNVGEASDYSTAVEEGNAVHHKTTLTLDGALPAIAGGAALAVGRLIYTLPEGVIRIISAYFNGVAITQSEGNITADTPDVGIGNVIASGAVAVLSGTGTFENVLTGQTMADCDGTAKLAGAASSLIIGASDPHTLYLNVADTWAASGDAEAAISGEVVITWEKLT